MNPIHLLIIGDELLSGKRSDKHLQKISSTLADRGAELTSCETVRDVHGSVRAAIEKHLDKKTLIITTGGLGPTVDDLTREGIAAATGSGLRFDEALWNNLKERYERRGRKISESSRSQALVPVDGTFFPNHFGTAPGLVFECADYPESLVVALPGPPRELNPMWDDQAIPYLVDRLNWPAPPHRILLRFIMAPEAGIDEKMRPILADYPEVNLSSLIRIGRVDVTLGLPSDYPNNTAILREIADRTQDEFKNYVFSRSEFIGEKPDRLIDLEEVVLDLLRERKQTLSCAESCTGGLVSKWLTDFPGSSDAFWGGVVAYDNSVKSNLLGVSTEILETEGAVSEPTARQMVAGLLDLMKTDWGIAITGIAGPGGGTEEKPVGLVYVAVGNREEIEVKRYDLPGDREFVRELSAGAALWMLWRQLT